MRAAILPILVPVLALAIGCVGEESRTLLVPDSPFKPPTAPASPASPAMTRASYAPAATQVAARVDTVGRNIIAANPQTGIRPLFMTIGSPQPEVFHRGTSEIGITEGLVKQCTTDAQLAAVLSYELGKMISEREALAAPRTRAMLQEPPQNVPVGNDSGGFYGSSADLTRLAEQAKFRPPASREAPPPPPDPKALARDYLTKAGFAPTELDLAEPILKAANANTAIEKQMTAQQPVRTWIK
ncbi:MAG: hypothetical protein K2R98_24835 [Gemmataceae bacterium]|nr:hypothetical protein [Gemmataceae bacterium]